uniref:Actin-related protein n=1 Tax=Panagrolaimus sp. ES5 TaxID=591445 RepID=A0AC34F5C1_9BILA
MVSPDEPSTTSPKCIIVDIGGKNCRIGVSNFEKPLLECLSCEKKEIYCIQESGTLGCNPYYEPILQRGIITNWNFVEKQIKEFLHHQKIFANKTSIIFTQSIAATEDDKEKAMHVLFEKLGFHSICTISDAYLSFITSGKSTGIIVQIGHSITEIIPIINGEPLLQYATYFKVSGFDISSELSSEINAFTFPSTNLPLKRDEIKEKMCYVPRDSTKELTKFNKNAKIQPPPVFLQRRSATGKAFIKRFEQQKSQNSSRICFEIAEIWFSIDFVKIITDTVAKVPLQYQDAMYANIIISGGTAQMKGFKERFEHEMVKKLPNTTSLNVNYANSDLANPSTSENNIPNTSLAAFRGAVILAKHPNFSKLLTKRDEYSPEQFRRNRMIRTSKRIKNASLLLSS